MDPSNGLPPFITLNRFVSIKLDQADRGSAYLSRFVVRTNDVLKINCSVLIAAAKRPLAQKFGGSEFI